VRAASAAAIVTAFAGSAAGPANRTSVQLAMISVAPSSAGVLAHLGTGSPQKIYLLYISPAIDCSARNVGGGVAIA
jgi:hypothetical protein